MRACRRRSGGHRCLSYPRSRRGCASSLRSSHARRSRKPVPHIATLKTFDPPLSALEGRRLEGSRRRGKNLLFPTADQELVLRVHLMSAGRLRYLAAGAKGPKTPMFRLRFAGGDELVLTEAGKKKRAGVWLVTPSQLDADLAHLGPDALDLDTAALAEILGRERRQLHPLLRDQQAIAGIGRAHANEILLRARLSPFKASTELVRGDGPPLCGHPRGSRANSSSACKARAMPTSISSTIGSVRTARSATLRLRVSTSRSTRSTTAELPDGRPAAQRPPPVATPALARHCVRWPM